MRSAISLIEISWKTIFISEISWNFGNREFQGIPWWNFWTLISPHRWTWLFTRSRWDLFFFHEPQVRDVWEVRAGPRGRRRVVSYRRNPPVEAFNFFENGNRRILLKHNSMIAKSKSQRASVWVALKGRFGFYGLTSAPRCPLYLSGQTTIVGTNFFFLKQRLRVEWPSFFVRKSSCFVLRLFSFFFLGGAN